jgi:predicted transcriptional regulator
MGRRRLVMGELEMEVLEHLWLHGAADVKTAHRAVGELRGIRSNTVQSTLERLHRKGLAERRKIGRAFEYRARVSPREWVAQRLDGLLADVPRADARVLFAAFVDLAERAGEERLADLERLVRERRRRPTGAR